MTASQKQDLKKVRIARGIRADRYGFDVYVKINRQQFSKRFPPNTPVSTMELWRSKKKAEAKGLIPMGRFSRVFKAYSAPLRRSVDGWCYVYFIQDGDMVKIGRAIDPMERLRNLQTAHSRELTLIAAVAAHADLERAVHARFQHCRNESTEWFRLEPDLEAFIDEMNQGKNPVPLVWGRVARVPLGKSAGSFKDHFKR